VWRRVLEYRQPSKRSNATKAYSPTCCKCDVEGCGDDCVCRAVKTECVDCPAGREVCDYQQIRRFRRNESKAVQWEIKDTGNPRIGRGMFITRAVRPAELVVVFRGSWKPRSETPKVAVSPCSTWFAPAYCLVQEILKISHEQKELEPTNDARFVNSSCAPSCYAEIWKVDGQDYAGIFAGPLGLKKGQEVTFDYSRGQARTTMRCRCGYVNCRKLI